MQKHKKKLEDLKEKIKKLLKKNKILQKEKFNVVSTKGKIYDRKIIIKLTSNNVYCTLIDFKTKKILIKGTAGTYRIYISKKRLKKNSFRILNIFFEEIKKKLTNNGILISLIAPLKLKKKIIKTFLHLRTYLSKNKNTKKIEKKYRSLIIKINSLKCFNGCRALKKKRKKRKGLRVLKF